MAVRGKDHAKGVRAGRFTHRTDMSYHEAHGLDDGAASRWDSVSVRSHTLSRASGSSVVSIITGAGGADIQSKQGLFLRPCGVEEALESRSTSRATD